MYRIIILLTLSVLSANSFIPSNGAGINYTQVFFKWPQIPQANGYELKIFQNGENEELFSGYSESNSLLVQNILNTIKCMNKQCQRNSVCFTKQCIGVE